MAFNNGIVDFMNKKKIAIKIMPSKIRGYSFEYHFISKREYIEYNLRRYLRIIEYLRKRGLICL